MIKKTNVSWTGLFFITFLSAYLYIFNEWLFISTKPSFLNSLSFPQQLNILLTTCALLASLALLGVVPLVLLSALPPLKKYKDILIKLGGLLPAGIFATLILMLVDNFTYTVFKWGIVSTERWSRAFYLLGFVIVVVLCYWRILIALARLSQRSKILGLKQNWVFGSLIGVLLLSISTLLFPGTAGTSPLSGTSPVGAKVRPDILLITADGLSADHMSVYGYTRDTTPRINQLAESAMVGENAFPNSGKTTGSLTSIYTGKYPAQTRLLLPPDVLKGDDAYEHLPGILLAQGYRTVQITSPFYADANSLNLLEGFEQVKTSSGVTYSKYINVISKLLPDDKALFVDEVMKRFVDRIRHIFFIQKMANPYLMVTRMSDPLLDIERVEFAKNELHTSKQPLFIHIHLMVTHGPKFQVPEQIYSAGQATESQALWNADFYDDSILAFDQNIGDLIDSLSELGLLENTVVIIASDHGQRWDPVKRVPLIIRFPHGEYAGRINANIQNLDIAPTILDYIGVDQPNWMSGNSLIAGEMEQRLIFGMTAVDPEDLGPNTTLVYGVSENLYIITLISCQKWYLLDMRMLDWKAGKVLGTTTVCPPEKNITEKQAYQLMIKYLQENNYDLSTLDEQSLGNE